MAAPSRSESGFRELKSAVRLSSEAGGICFCPQHPRLLTHPEPPATLTPSAPMSPARFQRVVVQALFSLLLSWQLAGSAPARLASGAGKVLWMALLAALLFFVVEHTPALFRAAANVLRTLCLPLLPARRAARYSGQSSSAELPSPLRRVPLFQRPPPALSL